MPTLTPILRGLFRSTRVNLKPTKPTSSSSSLPTPPTPPTTRTPPTHSNIPPNASKDAPSWLGHPFRVIVNTLKWVAAAHLFWEYGMSMAPASGPSMLPTFEVLGEWLVVSKLHRFGRGVSVGDVVAYNIPINEEVGVKRVLGLPGDYVLMDTPEGGDGGGGGSGGGSMIQVRRNAGVLGTRIADFDNDRCRKVIVGLSGITWLRRGTRGTLARYRSA